MSRSFENIKSVAVDGLKYAVLQNEAWFWLVTQRVKYQRNTA
jgi:hypothetical protein